MSFNSLVSTVTVVISLLHCTVKGDYPVSLWATTIINPSYPSNKIPLRIHYPTINSSQSISFPLIVFNHGGDCKNTWYDYVWQNLVPQGYIVAMPGDYEHPWIWEYTYASAQRYTLDWMMDSCNTNASCPLYQMVGTKAMASGHSMGGGASFLSISNFNFPTNETFTHEFDAAFTLSGCDNRYDELTNSLKNTPSGKAVFILSGSSDCICPPEHNSDVFYNDLPNDVCKFVADITNGTHCHFEEASQFGMDECEAAEEVIFCPFHDHKDNLPPKQQYEFVKEYMTLFVNATLQGDVINQDTVQMIKDKLQSDKNAAKMTHVDSNC